jgi:hypothetical protein
MGCFVWQLSKLVLEIVVGRWQLALRVRGEVNIFIVCFLFVVIVNEFEVGLLHLLKNPATDKDGSRPAGSTFVPA